MDSGKMSYSILLGFALVAASTFVLPFQGGHYASAADAGRVGAGLHILKGQISNIQTDSSGTPAWIQSGIWILWVNVGPNNDVQSSHLIARFSMVKPDGTAMHKHTMYNFKATEMSQEGNSTRVLKGTATVTMRDGPVTDVPLTIKVFNNAVIGFWIGPDKIDSHFGSGPVYGTLATNSRSIMMELGSTLRNSQMTNNSAPSTSPSNFVSSIDNPYFTLKTGATYTYETKTDEGTEKNIVIVTNQTKTVQGIATVVVWDRVWLDEELIEETYDWYAQDKSGNVWYFGEDSKEYEDGKVSTEGSWEAGVNGAEAGIIMKANPAVGDSYRQEYYKGHAEDMADVVSLNQTVTVPYGSFSDCLQTREWSKIESDLNEHKYYCKEVGGVALEVVIDGGERSELLKVE